MSKYYITRDVYGELTIFTNRPTKDFLYGRCRIGNNIKN